MSASWQTTTLSTRDLQGRYIDDCVAADPSFERTYDALEAIASVDVELWRITRDDERTSATSPKEELMTGAVTTTIVGRYVVVAVAGTVMHEVYRIVLVFTPATGGDWSRTRMLEAVA